MKLTYSTHPGKTGSQRRQQTTFTPEQLDALEAVYSDNSHPDVQVRVRLAIKLGLTGNNILIWFKNRRANTRNTDYNDANKVAPNSPRADTVTADNDDVRKRTPTYRLLKKRSQNNNYVTIATPKQLRCVYNNVSDGKEWIAEANIDACFMRDGIHGFKLHAECN
ncbi:homeobox protein goosecoid-2-like [Dreissena polymorpha]|uniref:Homeobox domain-containing protein n=1 Tax=Dreissena polymorpha TaxID=45954 RepID=A0A9D4CDV0_DREPO|nr:homeobox protein goosecoid-2-like [Dreissena polymorpha]KAH3721529.1 hypothetical protein DPMN_064458 [Dreissena polymorpha]